MSNEREARFIYESMKEHCAGLREARELGVTSISIDTAVRLAEVGAMVASLLITECAKTDERARVTRGITDALDGAIARLDRTSRY